MTVDAGITITLTSDETLALAKAVSFYMQYSAKVGFNKERAETARGLASFSQKMLPSIQHKVTDE